MTPTSKLPSSTVHRPFVIPAAAAPDARDNVATRTVIDLERYRMRCNAQPAATPLSVRLNSPQHTNPVRKLFADRGFSVEDIPDIAFEWVRPSHLEIKDLPTDFYRVDDLDVNTRFHRFDHITDRMIGIGSGESEKNYLRGCFDALGDYEIVLAYTPVTIIKQCGSRVYRLSKNETFATNLRTGILEDDDLVSLKNGDVVILQDGTMFSFWSPLSHRLRWAHPSCEPAKNSYWPANWGCEK